MATLQFAHNNSNSNTEVPIDIPSPKELINAAAHELVGGNPRQLARPLFSVGSWTIVSIVSRIVYKLPPGAIFEEHLMAYYLTLLGVFLAGVAEVYAAILLSKARYDGGRVHAIAAPLLCASVVLLAALVALGGSPVPVMG